MVKGEVRNHFDAFVLWLPPSGIFGAHRAFAGHLLHAICYAFTGGNMGLSWLLDICRLSTMIPKGLNLDSSRHVLDTCTDGISDLCVIIFSIRTKTSSIR